MRTKTKRPVSVIYLGAEGVGATKTEAKEAAKKLIERTFDGYHSPQFIGWRGTVGIMYRYLDRWDYTILREDALKKTGWFSQFSSSGFDDKDDCEANLRSHLAQNGWEHKDGYEVLPEILDVRCVNVERRREFLSWAKWQSFYAIAKAEGKNDEQCRAYADQKQYDR